MRGDLLVKLGRFDEARAEFERAASLTRNARERELLLARSTGVPATTELTQALPASSRARRCSQNASSEKAVQTSV